MDNGIVLIPSVTNPVISEEYENFMPLGLLSIAASLIQNNYDCLIYQPNIPLFDEKGYNDIAMEILRYKRKVVGFSTWCNSFPSSLIIAKKIKSLSPNTIVLFGGPQASILAKEILSNFSFVDFVLTGEADATIVQFVKEIYNHGDKNILYRTRGLVYRDYSGKVIQNDKSDIIEDLDSLPIPQYKLIDTKESSVSLDVGRGCPFKCTFCTTSDFFSKSYRVKTVNRIIEEMDYLWSARAVSGFSFTHDMFTLNKKFIKNLCNRLIKHEKNYKRNYTWTCSARIDCVDKELLEIMHKAGCRGIFFGIETGSLRMQKIIKKNLKIDKSYEVISQCVQIGLSCSAAFIAGFPDETRADLEETLQAILKIFALGGKPQISLLSLLPQTPLYEKYKKHLLLDNYATDFTGGFNSHIERELIDNYPDLFSSFYYLPVESASRETMIKINTLVNNISKYFGTFKIINEKIQRVINEGRSEAPLLSFIENNIDQNDPIESLVHLLADFICKYKKELPEITSDVFIAETGGMFVCQRLLVSQLLNRRKFTWGDALYNDEKWLVPTPHWTVIRTDYPVSELSGFVKDDCRGTIDQKVSYTLVVPKDEKEAIYYNIKRWQLDALKELKEKIRVDAFLCKLKEYDNKKDYEKFLSRIAKLDIIRFSNSDDIEQIADSPAVALEKNLYKWGVTSVC